MNALFINPGGIGDQILLLPTVKLLKEKFNDIEIDLLCEPRSTSVGELTDIYRKIKGFDFKKKNLDIFELVTLLRKRKYKYLISTGASYKANFTASLADAEIKIGFLKGILSNFLITHSVVLNTKQYAPNMFASLLTPIIPEVKKLIQEKDLLPEIKINHECIEWAKEILTPKTKERYHAKKIFIHPGTSKLSIQKNILKTWSSTNWASLIEKLIANDDNTVVLLGGKDDSEIIADIHKKLTFFTRPKNFVDLSSLEISLSQLAALISISDLFICIDSAPMHLAVGLGKRLVAFFGPTDPQKLLPKDSRFSPIHVTNLSCRPCLFDIRKESCSTPECLELPVDSMLKVVEEYLKQL